MAKTLYLTNAAASAHRGNNDAKLNAAASFWTPKALAESRGVDTTGTAVTATAATVAGATPGVEVGVSSIPYEWVSEPLSADFTVSGLITLNLWAGESSNSANSAINAAVDKIDGVTGALTRIATSVRVTELGTSAAVANFTVTPTSTACKRGDRLRVRVFADDAGTMGSGFTVTHWFDRSTAAVQGESFLTFTEDLTFELAGGPPNVLVEVTGTAGSTQFGIPTRTTLAQSFVAQSPTIDSVSVWLATLNAPTDGVTVDIQTLNAVNGNPSGVLVGTVGTIAASSLSSALTRYVITGTVALTVGTTYFVVVRRSGAADSTNRYSANVNIAPLAGWNVGKALSASWADLAGPMQIGLSYRCPSYYLTDTAATINPGSATEKQALTTRGSGSVNAVTNTAAGPTAPIQVTASAGGTAIEWYTPALNAFSLGGKAKLNVRALESNLSANASLKAEIAVCATDGTSPVVWGVADIQSDATGGELTASDAAYVAWVSGANVSVTAGQRLRFRIYLDDVAIGPLVTGFTVTVSYNGVTASAAGDTYVVLPVLVTEQPTATTWNGAAAANLTDALVTAGTRETFSSAAAGLADNWVIAGTRETFSASTVPLTAGVTTSGQVVALISGVSAVTETATVTTAGVRERLAATATSETVGVVTSATVAATAASAVTQTASITTLGLVTANAAATVQLTDTVTTSGTAGTGAQTYFGAATVALTATATTAGVRDTTGSSTTNLSATVTTLGTRTLATASTAASVATVTSAGTRETFGASATTEAVLVTTSSGTGSAGAATVSLTGTVTTSGTRVAVTTSTVSLAVNVTTTGTVTAGASATAALTDTVTTAGSRTTFSTSAVPLTVAVTTLGAKVKFGDVTVTEHVTITTGGYRDVLATTTVDLHVQIVANSDVIVPLPPGRIDTITIGGITHTIWRGIDGTQQGELSTSNDGNLAKAGAA